LNGNAETYDALDRRVEQYNGSAYTDIVYGPGGNKMALMNGQTVTKVFAPLSAGATAVYTSSGLAYYRHPDWLGSSRIASTPSRTLYYDGAYAPFGENYAETGTTDRNFTGQNQDMAANLYDFPYREYHSIQGRWVSPDRAGLAVASPANPQSWNRYTYALNNPLRYIDPSGLDYCAPGSVWYDDAGNVGYDDSQCVSDDQYGDGSAYPGYIYVSTTENVTVDDNSSSSASVLGSALGMLGWGYSQLANGVNAAASAIKSVACTTLNITLGAAASATHSTVGVGYGGGAGLGLAVGASAGGGVQAVADQYGNYGIAISVQGNPGWGVYGASASAGRQYMQSNTPTIYGLRGFGVDLNGAVGDEVALGVDVNASTEGTTSVTLTVGPGAGLRYSGSSNVSYTAVPFSIHCGG
jgi:RHS repeat-associated protein